MNGQMFLWAVKTLVRVTEDRGAVLAAWRGLVQHASARDGGLVGVLPPVDNDEETPGGVRTH